jgi:hypothetical protein
MRTVVFCAFIVLVALAALLPPFITRGACTEEFDEVASLLEGARPQLLTLAAAQQFLAKHGLAYRLVSAESCESTPQRDVEGCPGGALLLGSVPVRNPVCRFYRDSSVRFHLGFNPHEQLVRIQADMNPYGRILIPYFGEVDLAR